jgi:hypothetical protein
MGIEEIVRKGIILFEVLILSGCLTETPKTIPKKTAPIPGITLPYTDIPYKEKRPKNGDVPYSEYFGEGEWKTLFLCENRIAFKNEGIKDVIVFLVDDFTGGITRHNYIRADSSYNMGAIPDGDYFIKVLSGREWNPDRMLNTFHANRKTGKLERMQGGFDIDMSFTICDLPSNYLRMRSYKDNKSCHYTFGEITLYSAENGNVGGRDVSESEFFN